jgi:GPH family glycoside/pentoside/hexuronide:cation symporter
MSAIAVGRDFSPKSQRRALVAAGFGQVILLTFVGTFQLMYLLEYARISSAGMAIVAVIMSIGKIFDAINDPIMGTIVDKTRSRWGKLRPYILFSAAPVAVSSFLLYCLPNGPENLKIVFFGVMYVLWDICYTLCDVPYWALVGAVFEEPAERTKTISHIRAVMSIATGAVVLGAPWLARLLSFGPQTTGAGWSLAAIVICVAGMALFTLAFFGTRERKNTAQAEQVSLGQLFRTLAKNKPLCIVLAGSIVGFGRGMISTGGAVFVVIAYNNEGMFTLIGAAIIAGSVLASFAAPYISAKLPDKWLMITSNILSALCSGVMYLVGFNNVPLIMALIFGIGLSMGLFSVAETTMIAASVDHIERRTGIRNDGISFSTLTFVAKLKGSLAVLVFGLVITASHYEKGVTVTPEMQNMIFSAITLIPMFSSALSTIPFSFFKLD